MREECHRQLRGIDSHDFPRQNDQERERGPYPRTMVASRILRRAPLYLYVPVNTHLHMHVELRLYGGRGMWVRKPMLLTSDSTLLAFVAPNFRLYQIWSYAIRRLPRC